MTLTKKGKTYFERIQTQNVFKPADIKKITKQINETIDIVTCFKCDESKADLFNVVIHLQLFLEQINDMSSLQEVRARSMGILLQQQVKNLQRIVQQQKI